MKKKTIKGFANLDYLTLTNVPVRQSAKGEIIDISLSELERVASIAIIENKLPIRGAEIKLFRSVLGLSLAAFGERLGYKDTTILNWEKKPNKRLSLVNEVAVKLLVGEYLGLPLSPSMDELRGLDKAKNIKVSAA